jgi:hypothetical protein
MGAVQVRPDGDFDKIIDLDAVEIGRTPPKEPFFGPAAMPTLILFLLGFPVSALATLLVTGEFPYWLRHLLQ